MEAFNIKLSDSVKLVKTLNNILQARKNKLIENIRRLLKCEICGKLFRTKQIFFMHMKQHALQSITYTEGDELTSKPNSEFGKCIPQTINDTKQTSSVLGTEDESKDDRIQYVYRESSNNRLRYNCDKCGASFLQKIQIRLHVGMCYGHISYKLISKSFTENADSQNDFSVITSDDSFFYEGHTVRCDDETLSVNEQKHKFQLLNCV